MTRALNPTRSLGWAKIISTRPQKPTNGPALGGPGSGTGVDIFKFQFWPESLHDTKSVEYAKKTVLGSSHPLYQFIHGGERSLTFTAVFTRDRAPSLSEGILNSSGVVGAIANTPFVDDYNADINATVWALRRFMYPSYGTGDLKAFPPEFIQLQMDNTAIGGYGFHPVDIMDCIMSRCDVTYHAWFPSGAPRYITVDLEFWETIQGDQSNPADIRYVDRMSFSNAWEMYLSRQGIPRKPKKVSFL